LSVASNILVGIQNKAVQEHQGITIVRWDDEADFSVAAGVVLETFACDLPEAYLANMSAKTVWVNVDHLSAEPWVADFHGLHSKYQHSDLVRHFFFPGFEEKTGGLSREQGLIAHRDAFQQSAVLQDEFWASFGIQLNRADLKISLFSYHNAPIEALLDHLAQGEQKVSLFLPFNEALPKALLGNQHLTMGDRLTSGNLTVHILPFLTLENYDKLLWSCDINFVRGEESWVRALWAGKPFIWQPYLQVDNAHLVKLNAFLKTLYGDCARKQVVSALHQAWSVEEFYAVFWQTYLSHLAEIEEHTRQQTDAMVAQTALVPRLVAFCEKLAN